LRKPSYGTHTRGHAARVRDVALSRKRESVERQVAAADWQIDALVYELYGLKEDEIRVVEDAQAIRR
jgi:hypothetical protein